ncbi:hypothetical protein TSA6c_17115 [Azospirillum sp. TSA6c]|uniref:hypothetical protein n=1 Tax=Azospirillum sp. TSA6c TaxID=709813 RepID=UPI000D61416B|nr:hypothetical protein [Azospirillum sp. TSA6c]PWC48155.1 hypothetical protein TSA6c_17115 [Azospirillum sp. TSA6c]
MSSITEHPSTLEEALASVRAGAVTGLKLSRIVAYSLGDGDSISRRVYELYGPSMTEPGKKKSVSGWLPVHYAEDLEGASAALPRPPVVDKGAVPHPSDCWGIMSGRHPDGRYFARAWRGDGKGDNPVINVTKAPSEVIARLDAALQARIWEEQRTAKKSDSLAA